MPLDTTRVCLMARSGVPMAVIAERLGVSTRHVRRILEAYDVKIPPNLLIGTPDEYLVWSLYRKAGESVAEVAYRFGFSRQHIHRLLNQAAQSQSQ